jgi:exonuclease VII small subunit
MIRAETNSELNDCLEVVDAGEKVIKKCEETLAVADRQVEEQTKALEASKKETSSAKVERNVTFGAFMLLLLKVVIFL